MTATLHKITAGDGYEYYTRHVAAHDATEPGGGALANYYIARGETPGQWIGSGLPDLAMRFQDKPVAVSTVETGSAVTAEQLKALFGQGVHPQAAGIRSSVTAQALAAGATRRQAVRSAELVAALGERFRIYAPSTFRRRCAQSFCEFNMAGGRPRRAPLADHDRARIRSAIAREMFVEELGRGPLNDRELSAWIARHNRHTTTAVAGYDWTFSPVKSVSVLWAVAPCAIADQVEAAHRAAVADALTFLESHAAFTRRGRNGVEHLEITGLIAAVFQHRDSRAGDPDLHTHLVVSNKVKTRVDGRWRALDGSMFYRSAVAASEVYNTRLELHLQPLGVRFAERPGTGAGKQPVREIVGVDARLARYWSQRQAQVVKRLDRLSIDFQRTHGREPTPAEMYTLNQRAVLDTRAPKQHHTHAEQRQTWRAQAITVLGGRPALENMLATILDGPPATGAVIDEVWIQRCADAVIEAVSAKRSTWRRWHVRSEVERRIRGHVARDHWQHVAEAVTTAALSPPRSIPRGDPDRHAEPALRTPPALFTRSDGTSIFQPADVVVYTTPAVLDLEARLAEMSLQAGAHALPAHVVEDAIAEHNRDPANRRRRLNEGQMAMVRAFATSRRLIQFGSAPAGSGKTSAMRVLTRAWLASGASVLGLAPTARAAAVLQAETGVRVATVDKLLHVLAQHHATPQQQATTDRNLRPSLPQWVLDIDNRTLVIVDEHMQIADLPRLRMLTYLLARGATIRMIGDDQQLPAVDASGAAADMMRAHPPVSLTHVVRFTDSAEASASLMLREGSAAALGFYLDRDRIHIGAPGAVVDAAFTAWRRDDEHGRDSIMLAPTHALVAELNTLARAHRLTHTDSADREVLLADDLSASRGNILRTTRNEPALSVGESDYVRNGYQWVLDTVHGDGSITATHLLPGRELGATVHLPATYVATSVRLGYAATIDSAQGTTTDTCHVALTGRETRNQLYVALTRGRLANHLYLTTAVDGSEQSFLSTHAALPRTAVDILTQILARDSTAVSAHADLRHTRDPHRRLGHAVDIYLDALDLAATDLLSQDLTIDLDAAAEHTLPGLTRLPGYSTVRQQLLSLACRGEDAIAALREAISARELSTAADICAVLAWRLDPNGTYSTPPGPLPWLPGIPNALVERAGIGDYLCARARIITVLAEQIRRHARDLIPATAPAWARPLLGGDPRLLAELAVWRAAGHIPDEDLRPCGPNRHTAAERRHHELLSARVNEAITDGHLAVNVWAAAAKRINGRILDDPFWPVLADRLDTAARAGIDIETHLHDAAATGPLPDAMPAAALWFRLHTLTLDALDTGNPGPALAPHFAEEVRAALGLDLGDRVVTDPAWPRLVAALERATAHGTSTLRQALNTAITLINEQRGDHTDTVRPDQYALALAWRIDHLTDHEAAQSLDDRTPEPPGEPDDTHSEPIDIPSPPDHATPPTPPGDPAPKTCPGEGHEPPIGTRRGGGEGSDAPQLNSDDIRSVAALFAAGADRTARAALENLPEEHRRILRRIEATLRHYPFPIARARLHQAALDNPHATDLIQTCIPATDPGLHQPDHDTSPTTHYTRDRRREAPRDNPTRNDPTHRRQSPGVDRDVHEHLVGRVDHIYGTNDDLRTHRRNQYGSGENEPELTLPRDLPCVACGLERPLRDPHPPSTAGDGYDDGLCSECRANGVVGVPPHPPGRALIARCEHLTTTNPVQHALALLRRDWRRLPLAHRVAMTTWIRDQNLEHGPDEVNSLLALTDAQLDTAIDDIRAEIALHTTLDAVSNRRNTTPSAGGTPIELNSEARDAVTEARKTAAIVHSLRTRIRELSAEASHVRAALPTAGRSARPALERRLSAAGQKKRELVTALNAARRAADDARQQAELLTRPHPRFQGLTDDRTSDPRNSPEGLQHANDSPAPAHLLRRLDELTAERERRDASVPRERRREDTHLIEQGLEQRDPSPPTPPTRSRPETTRGPVSDLEL
ncbi:MobF family relaxase [Nocardia farcinica]|uniref:MobF family relaxase n=1 Tax=Nocardia farcinica TaxID=37329 RepID=UPI002456D025|nr:MobF family relaxase [Nocardia farcinica]